jgi:hypothetical protein
MSDPRYTIAADGRSITCGACGATSYHPGDVQHRYCGRCKAFHDDCSVEYDCTECGRHIFQLGGPLTRKCAFCTAMPGWFRDPDMAKRLDPEMLRNPPGEGST